MKRILLPAACLLWLALPLASEAAGPRHPLRAILQLEEDFDRAPDSDRPDSLPLEIGGDPQDVDINSILRINVSFGRYREALRRDPGLAARVSPEVAELLGMSDRLQQAAGFMQEAVEDGARLMRMVARDQRGSEEFRALARGDQERLREVLGILTGYLDFLAGSSKDDYRQRAEEVRRTANDAILSGPESSRFAVASVLLGEVEWAVGELEQAGAGISENPPSLALVLSAVHLHGGQRIEVGLPGYNDIPVDVPVRVDKLSLVPSPEDLAEVEELRAEAQAWADLLNQLRDGSKSLRDALEEVLEAQGVSFTELESAIDQVKTDLDELRSTDWRALGEDLEQRLEEVLESAADDAERELLESDVRPGVESLVGNLRGFRIDLVRLFDEVQRLRPLISQAAGEADTDPVSALVTLVGAVQTGRDLVREGELLFDELKSDVEDWRSAAGEIGQEVEGLRETLSGLADEQRQELEEVLESVAPEPVTRLIDDLETLETAVESFVGGLRGLVDNRDDVLVRLAVAGEIDPPDTSFTVPLDQAEPTRLDIRSLNPRKEGDWVILRAWLYETEPAADDPRTRVRGREVDQLSQQLQLLRFGWYTSPSVGLTYLSSFDPVAQGDGDAQGDGEEEVDETRSFVPQVSWLLNRRSWRKASEPARYYPKWYEQIGFGFHTVTLDLDNDNQLEMGLGFTVSFYKDLFQIGAGIDLSLDEEPYYFIGTRLFEFAKGLGTKNQPAETGQ